MDNKYVLAMYDIRGKQEFIFKCNHLKEIVGGSALIRDCFKDYLFCIDEPNVFGKGIFHDSKEAFSKEGFEKHLEEGYIGEVVYEGGGNFILLYKNDTTFKEMTYRFTKNVLENVGTLKIIASYKEGVNFDDYSSDRDELYRIHRINEARECNVMPWGTLPIVQVDRRTFMPYVDILSDEEAGHDGKVKASKESKAKYKKYCEETKTNEDEIGQKILDNLVKEKGKDSILAVVYIDGNNMGNKVQQCLGNERSYDACVNALRKFSVDIQKDYIDDRKADIDARLEEKYKKNKKLSNKKRRLVLGAGDEINFICNAHDALDLAETYLKGLENVEDASSCAGIAIFHSHAPYSEAYRIAEECCESGKIKMKEKHLEDVSFIDYHFCQSGIGVSLDKIREFENTSDSSRPWLLNEPQEPSDEIDDIIRFDQVKKVMGILAKIGRSNVKGLAAAARSGESELEFELKRIQAHMSETKRKEMKADFDYLDKMDKKVKRKLIYDIVIVYDIWVEKETNNDEAGNNNN